MKPTHNDNALFSLFHSRNDSLFQRKDWILAFILGGLYFRSLPALPPFIISDFLRTGWGVCANSGLQPLRLGYLWPGARDTWNQAHAGSGDMKGLAFILATQTKGSPRNLGEVDLPTHKAGCTPAIGWKSGYYSPVHLAKQCHAVF